MGTALDDIHRKLLKEMDDIEIAIWYTSGATKAYDMEKAAAELTALRERVTELEKMLKRVEFVTDQYEESSCPVCCGLNPSHYEDCELAAALRGDE